MPAPRTPPAPKGTVPGLPPFDPAAALTLADAIKQKLVPAPPGGRMSVAQLVRWCTRGCTVARGGPRVVFPSLKGPRERLTCPAWCRAWAAYTDRLRAADVKRQVDVLARLGLAE